MAQVQKSKPAKDLFKFNFRNFIVGIILFLVEVLVPVIISSGVLFWLSGTIKIWKMDHNLAISLLAILFVLFSLLIAALLSELISRLQNKKNPRAKLVIMLEGGLILPIGIFVAANMLFIAPNETYIARAISLSETQNVDVTMLQLGTTVINSTNTYTKVLGINTIKTIHSSTGMDELFQVLNNDPTALSDPQVSDALSQAIASYGTNAKTDLLSAFQSHVNSTKSTNIPTNIYTRYFSQSMASIQSEINSQTVDAATKTEELADLSSIAAQLQADLGNIETKSWQASNSDPMPDFVLDTFLAMNITSDGDIYSLALNAVSNTNYPDSIRGKALLLIAKLGDSSDMTLLYGYLGDNSELVKADAFQAITNLTTKLNGTTTNSSK